ncbi:MAG: helix-hairpin-helix domain-containing protein [Clostridiaceae bacterium]|nr:helix-hairpin-helix domain-containing protein [Clostridiaceae bacterium]
MRITLKQKLILVVFAITVMIAISFRSYINDKKEIYILSDTQEKEIKKVQVQAETAVLDNKIIIHIEGEIIHPGIYKLQKDARIFDAVEVAGGLKNTADRSKVNLAKKIFDEEFIYIPSKEDENMPVIYTADAMNQNYTKININKASQSELETLTGIGSTLANRIVDYRNTEGPFKSIEEIQRVSGIGEAKFNDIKDKIVAR